MELKTLLREYAFLRALFSRLFKLDPSKKPIKFCKLTCILVLFFIIKTNVIDSAMDVITHTPVLVYIFLIILVIQVSYYNKYKNTESVLKCTLNDDSKWAYEKYTYSKTYRSYSD